MSFQMQVMAVHAGNHANGQSEMGVLGIKMNFGHKII
jgi:phosphotransferase system HPr-like phosphotransfer protein